MLSGSETLPLVSVIMPAYNSDRHIREAIDSILSQTYRNLELLIIDDACTDDTGSIIDSFTDSRIRVFRNQKNQGKTSSVNQVFKFCRGSLITIHDSDDVSLPSRFEVQVKAMMSDANLVMCGTNFVTEDLNGRELERSNMLIEDTSLKAGLHQNSQFHGPTVMFSLEAAQKLGEIYRPFFKDYNEDYDFCFRISELGAVANCPEHLYRYRITPGSLSRSLTPQKKISTRIVQYLADQRLQEGADDLIRGEVHKVEALVESLAGPYKRDRSLIYRQQSELDFYYGFYRKALKSSLDAVVTNPFVIANYRLLQHILRKRIFGF